MLLPQKYANFENVYPPKVCKWQNIHLCKHWLNLGARIENFSYLGTCTCPSGVSWHADTQIFQNVWCCLVGDGWVSSCSIREGKQEQQYI